MMTTLRNLSTTEITRRIREAMIYILDCQPTYFVDVYQLASKMARETFKVTDEDKWYAIGCAVAQSYTETHGQPEV